MCLSLCYNQYITVEVIIYVTFLISDNEHKDSRSWIVFLSCLPDETVCNLTKGHFVLSFLHQWTKSRLNTQEVSKGQNHLNMQNCRQEMAYPIPCTGVWKEIHH